MGNVAIKKSSTVEQERIDNAAHQVRQKRDRLLAESDFTQIPDSPFDATTWQPYRQALRDITAQSGFPTDVEWPESP